MGAEAVGGAGAGLRAGFWAAPSAPQRFLQLPGSRRSCRLVRPWAGEGAGRRRSVSSRPLSARSRSPLLRPVPRPLGAGHQSVLPADGRARGRGWTGTAVPESGAAVRRDPAQLCPAVRVQGPGRGPLERPLPSPDLAVWGDFSSSVTEIQREAGLASLAPAACFAGLCIPPTRASFTVCSQGAGRFCSREGHAVL